MIGRTTNAIKIKTDDGGLRAVNCACCDVDVCGQVYPLEMINILTSQQYSSILNSETLSYNLQMTYNGITKGESGTANISSGCIKFFEPYPDYPLPPIYIYFYSRLGILEGKKNINTLCLFFSEYDDIGGITVVAQTGEYEPTNPSGIFKIKIKGITVFSLIWDNLTNYDVTASGFFDFQ